MNILRRSIWLAVVVSILPAIAHQDPLGEVHPEVVVVDRQFQVFYTDNSISTSIAPPTPIAFRRVFDDRGKLVRDSEVIPSDRATPTKDQPRIDLPEPLTGRSHRFAGNDYIIPEWPRNHQGKPFYLVADEKHYARKDLHWQDNLIVIVEDFVVTETSLLILATRQKPTPASVSGSADLWLFHFEKATGVLVKQQRLGDPAFIYDFPRVSRLTNNDGIVRVVWLERQKATDKPTLRLGTYNLPKKSFDDRPLPYETNWNTSISIGVIADVLCLAYHGVSPKLTIKFVDLRRP